MAFSYYFDVQMTNCCCNTMKQIFTLL